VVPSVLDVIALFADVPVVSLRLSRAGTRHSVLYIACVDTRPTADCGAVSHGPRIALPTASHSTLMELPDLWFSQW
jgi:hypothetical protein